MYLYLINLSVYIFIYVMFICIHMYFFKIKFLSPYIYSYIVSSSYIQLKLTTDLLIYIHRQSSWSSSSSNIIIIIRKLPSLISLPIENNYHYDISIKYVLFAANNYQIALGFIVSYALFIIIGQMIMKVGS